MFHVELIEPVVPICSITRKVIGTSHSLSHVLGPIAQLVDLPANTLRGYSSVGRASHSHCEGRGFEPPYLHQALARQAGRRIRIAKASGSNPLGSTKIQIVAQFGRAYEKLE